MEKFMEKFPVEYQDFWKRWSVFDGKSTVREFWVSWAVNFGITILFSLVGMILGTNFLGAVFGLAIIIPQWAVMIRRFHDTGKSGWYWLWLILPFVGWIIVLLALIKE